MSNNPIIRNSVVLEKKNGYAWKSKHFLTIKRKKLKENSFCQNKFISELQYFGNTKFRYFVNCSISVI